MNKKMFIYFNGTIAAFKAAGHETTYANSIVFISGNESGKGAAIYSHNKYYGSITEALNDLKYFSSISDGTTTAQASGPNGTIVFSGDDNATVNVTAGSNGVKIGIAPAVMTSISNNAAAIAKETEDRTAAVSGLDTRIATIEGDYLKGSDKTELQGYADQSETDAIAAAKSYTDAEIAKLDAVAQAEQVATNKANIETLIGSDADMSARAIVQDEVAKQLESENISESFDTLKEMAEYLSSHPQTVTDMNEAIQAATTKANEAYNDAATAYGKAVTAEDIGIEAKEAAQANTDTISGMTLTEISGYVTKISQANGKVSATAVANIPATDITIADTNDHFTGATVEAIVAELAEMWTWEELS